MSTDRGRIEELLEAWFALSEDMGRQWSQLAGAPGKDVREILNAWTDLSVEMGRGMVDLMEGSPGAYTGVGRTWSEWSERIAEQLSRARSSSPDAKGLRALQEAWARNSVRITKLLGEQMAKGVSDQMEGMARAARAVDRTVGPMTGAGTKDMAELTSTMARFWADHYAKVVQDAQEILAGDEDAMAKARKVNDAWFTFSSDMMRQVMRTGAFSRWMGDVRDADLDLMRRTRDAAEEGLRNAGMPTRTDMEEVQRSIKDLRMELRSLRQAVEGRPGATGGRGGAARKGSAASKRGPGARRGRGKAR